MSPGTNFEDGSPPWMHPALTLDDQKKLLAVILVIALVGFVAVVVWGVRSYLRDAARRRRRQP